MSGFAPLGLILVIMLGAAVAERSGMFSALIRASLANAPRAILTPIVAIIGMVSHHASDAAYVVFIPLAAIVYAAAGRHPVAGLAAAFAAVSGGYAGNVTPGQIDGLLSVTGWIDDDRLVTRKGRGAGLGIPIAKSLAEAHGGSLRFESVLGEGTRAILSFPQPPVTPEARF